MLRTMNSAGSALQHASRMNGTHQMTSARYASYALQGRHSILNCAIISTSLAVLNTLSRGCATSVMVTCCKAGLDGKGVPLNCSQMCEGRLPGRNLLGLSCLCCAAYGLRCRGAASDSDGMRYSAHCFRFLQVCEGIPAKVVQELGHPRNLLFIEGCSLR